MKETDDDTEQADTPQVPASIYRGIDLAAYRNTLSDGYATQRHDMPEFFLKEYKENRAEDRDPFDGFRIQIISTREVALADSAAKDFRLWADTTLAGFSPEAYVFFQQPYYKVHVGDFNNRKKADTFSRLVKQKFPDAWVVHDRINPYLVPADSIQIEME